MEIREFIIMRGLQGSGKTWWSKQWVLENPGTRVRVNNDDLRRMLGVYWQPDREGLVRAMREEFFKYAMGKGYNIVVDNMNLSEKTMASLKERVTWFNKYGGGGIRYEVKIIDLTDTPLDVCIERDKARPEPIGEAVIRETYNRYLMK